MAASRYVNTNFWKDNYIADLTKDEKLLFLYFLTNPRTTIAGVYEINVREIAFDTGITTEEINNILLKFAEDKKMFYEKGWLIVKNFVRHQRMNPSTTQGVDRVLSDCPTWVKDKYIALGVGNQQGTFDGI